MTGLNPNHNLSPTAQEHAAIGATKPPPALDLSHQSQPRQVTVGPLTTVDARELAYALPSGADRMADLRQKLELREQHRLAQRLALPQIGTVREAWAGGGAGEGPHYAQKPIFGLRELQGVQAPLDQTHDLKQALVYSIEGLAWRNHHKNDITLDPMAAAFAPVDSLEGQGGMAVISPAFLDGSLTFSPT